jgi:quinol monooxygenase YgiN
MELSTIVRFHAKEGEEEGVAAALRDQFAPVLAEPGCTRFEVFRSTRDKRLFYIHSRWRDEAAFEIHAELPHTVRFLERILPLVDHPLDVTRAYEFTP